MRRSRKRGRRKYGGKPPKPTPKPKREATSAPILALPTELLAAIFSLLLVPDVCRTVCRGFSEAVRMIPFVAHEWQLQMVRVRSLRSSYHDLIQHIQAPQPTPF